MSSNRAFPVRPDDGAARRCSVTLQGMALNALFPPAPRLPDDMTSALAKLDRARR